MSITSTHPQYDARKPDWELMRDTFEGERIIKEKREKYLKPTAGMELDGMRNTTDEGYKRYEAYLARAVFYDCVEAAVNALVGIMHIKPANVKVPSRLEGMLTSVTPEGEDIQSLLRRINTEQMLTARVGLLVDVNDGAKADEDPFIAVYQAETVLNWDDGRSEQGKQRLQFIVLNETEYERTPSLAWEIVKKYRLLACAQLAADDTPADGALYRSALLREGTSVPTREEMRTLSFAGRTMDEIPFVFCGCKDLVPAPDKPPLLALANLAVSIYRQDADYKNALHQMGQDTLVIAGAEQSEMEGEGKGGPRVGGGATIYVPENGSAQFIGVASEGIPHMATSLEADKEEASRMGGKLLENSGTSQESGDALSIRVSAKTASLMNIAITGAAALERALKLAAKWVGADPEEVEVVPNLDFAGQTLSGQEIVQLATAKSLGVVISHETIHSIMEQRGLTKKTFDEELEQIQKEEDQGIGVSLAMGTDTGLPGDPNQQDAQAQQDQQDAQDQTQGS